MFFCRCKTFFSVLLACAFALTVAFAVRSATVCKFADLVGERTFYLRSASSEAWTKSELGFFDCFKVKGESVSLRVENADEEFIKKLFAEYGATLVFKEETGDVVSYYGYTQKWNEKVEMDGACINLHVAMQKNGDRVSVGSPMIFGGF